LRWDGEVGGHRLEVQCLADIVAQRNHQLVGADFVAGSEFAGGSVGEANLVFGAEQQDVGEGGFDGVSDGASTLGGGFAEQVRGFAVGGIGRLQVSLMRRIDRHGAGERSAQHLVGSDQGFQAFVDLAIEPLLALLDGHHHQQADADADQGHQPNADQRCQHALPRTEIQTPHRLALCPHRS
jgi:hypothetical protein